MLNSHEQEFILVIDFKMPTIVGIIKLCPKQMPLSTDLSRKIASFVCSMVIFDDFHSFSCELSMRNILQSLGMTMFQGVAGALTVLMKDAIRPNLMQTLEVRS